MVVSAALGRDPRPALRRLGFAGAGLRRLAALLAQKQAARRWRRSRLGAAGLVLYAPEPAAGGALLGAIALAAISRGERPPASSRIATANTSASHPRQRLMVGQTFPRRHDDPAHRQNGCEQLSSRSVGGSSSSPGFAGARRAPAAGRRRPAGRERGREIAVARIEKQAEGDAAAPKSATAAAPPTRPPASERSAGGGGGERPAVLRSAAGGRHRWSAPALPPRKPRRRAAGDRTAKTSQSQRVRHAVRCRRAARGPAARRRRRRQRQASQAGPGAAGAQHRRREQHAAGGGRETEVTSQRGSSLTGPAARTSAGVRRRAAPNGRRPFLPACASTAGRSSR